MIEGTGTAECEYAVVGSMMEESRRRKGLDRESEKAMEKSPG
ncbi:MAG: hypothetical protein WCQ50_13985 [Spirochaetota bacterium]